MPDYRRNHLAGGTYFFTVALADRRSDLLVRQVAALRAAVSRERLRHTFTIDAWVVLPGHLHAVCTLPEGDADYSTRWLLIKHAFSAQVPLGKARSASRIGKRERGIRQRRFWEHTVSDADDFRQHVDYVHFNPAKHGFVQSAGIGLIHRFTARSNVGTIRPIGLAKARPRAISVNGEAWWSPIEDPSLRGIPLRFD